MHFHRAHSEKESELKAVQEESARVAEALREELALGKEAKQALQVKLQLMDDSVRKSGAKVIELTVLR